VPIIIIIIIIIIATIDPGVALAPTATRLFRV
jgi:hypothetical protein